MQFKEGDILVHKFKPYIIAKVIIRGSSGMQLECQTNYTNSNGEQRVIGDRFVIPISLAEINYHLKKEFKDPRPSWF